MKHYTVAAIDITDRVWVRSYVAEVTKLVEQAGGTYLARTSSVERLEGERQPPGVVLLIEWPSREAAEAFYESPEYQPYREARLAGARNELFLVPGEDVSGVARIRT